uniref:Spindle pole component BBP1 n=1 Tax=Macrostomum lignano TaxID=282301 RepID=A0A1I8IT59_9PLAT
TRRDSPSPPRAAPPQPAVQYEATFDDNDVGNDEFDAGYQRRHGLVRTSAVLNPATAGKPLPISRETTARELARRAYMRGLNPSHYGVAMDNFEDAFDADPVARRPEPPDPIFHPGLVKDSPTSRQDAILLQLSTIRQGLLDKQKEIETSLSVS